MKAHQSEIKIQECEKTARLLLERTKSNTLEILIKGKNEQENGT